MGDYEYDEVASALSPFAVSPTAYARRTLYSWTTADQVAELGRDPKLLTRTVSAEGEIGRAQGVIAALPASDAMAAELNRSAYLNKRYAWTNPWATRLGWTGEDYGDRLLEINLRPEALTVALEVTSSGNSWRVQDLDGTEISVEDALKTPERIAALYFLDSRNASYCGFESRTAGSEYREYVIMNEAMIESWGVYTDSIRAELDRGIAALEVFQGALQRLQCDVTAICWKADVLSAWGAEPAPGTAYESALAFPNDLYAPTRGNIARLLERLKAVPFEDTPLEYRYDAGDAGAESPTEAPSITADAGASRQAEAGLPSTIE
jgi:hypothetical protein